MESTRDRRPFYISRANWQHRFSSAPLGATEGITVLSLEAETLRKKFAELLSWERRKRREQILTTVFCYALFAALLTLPFHGLLEAVISRWFIPLLFFGFMAPFFLAKGYWRPTDSARALARVDKTLRLDERALTAWELLKRNETRAAALMVLKQAGKKLADVDPKALFRRSWSWQAWCAPPLLLLWLGLLWFEVGLRLDSNVQLATPQTVAQKLREFSRALQEKAKNEGLDESLRVGRELEQAAQKGIDAKTGDEKFKADLAGVQNQIATMGKSAAEQQSLSASESQQDLRDLKAELEAARDLLNIGDGTKGAQELGKQWLDQLATLPQLKKQFERESQAGRSLSQSDLKSLLDKLDKQATQELDRRTLLDGKQFLGRLMKEGRGEKGDSEKKVGGLRRRGATENGGRRERRSSLTGKARGR